MIPDARGRFKGGGPAPAGPMVGRLLLVAQPAIARGGPELLGDHCVACVAGVNIVERRTEKRERAEGCWLRLRQVDRGGRIGDPGAVCGGRDRNRVVERASYGNALWRDGGIRIV